MPGIYELIGGKVSVNRLREVDITDLSAASLRVTDETCLWRGARQTSPLVTGAGGSIGRELCRQIARRDPSELVLLGHGENSTFEILLELNQIIRLFPSRPSSRMFATRNVMQNFSQYQPQVVFHAAAHKHVLLMEVNIVECDHEQRHRHVTSSKPRSAKTSNDLSSSPPTSRPPVIHLRRATKRLAEMIVFGVKTDTETRTQVNTQYAERSNQHAFSVGEIWQRPGSRGSIIPIFKNQIAGGGPVTITHPDMYRFFHDHSRSGLSRARRVHGKRWRDFRSQHGRTCPHSRSRRRFDLDSSDPGFA
ncbi:MAG: polysaccharide biosynthesis protein [Anaerolineales bacterium]